MMDIVKNNLICLFWHISNIFGSKAYTLGWHLENADMQKATVKTQCFCQLLTLLQIDFSLSLFLNYFLVEGKFWRRLMEELEGVKGAYVTLGRAQSSSRVRVLCFQGENHTCQGLVRLRAAWEKFEYVQEVCVKSHFYHLKFIFCSDIYKTLSICVCYTRRGSTLFILSLPFILTITSYLSLKYLIATIETSYNS